jgi:hypothetical protein
MDETGSGSCPVVGFDITVFEHTRYFNDVCVGLLAYNSACGRYQHFGRVYNASTSALMYLSEFLLPLKLHDHLRAPAVRKYPPRPIRQKAGCAQNRGEVVAKVSIPATAGFRNSVLQPVTLTTVGDRKVERQLTSVFKIWKFLTQKN